MKRKHKAPQKEMDFGQEAFALVPEVVIDGAAIEAGARKAEQDRQENETKQETMKGLYGTWNL